MAETAIEWTDKVWNPVTGCTKVSAGCKHCYAEKVADRFWAKQYPDVTEPHPEDEGVISRPRRFTDVQCHPDRLDQPLRWRKPRRIFVNSMSDLFHEDVPDEFIDRVFWIMRFAPQHQFQVLTKRPRRLAVYKPRWVRGYAGLPEPLWPLPNVHLGVSCEDQKTADERIPLLLQTPAAVRFLSLEPLLGPIELLYPISLWPNGPRYCCNSRDCGCRGEPCDPPAIWSPDSGMIDGVIVGGESGPGARPMDEDWVRSIRDQCVAAGVAFFYKQRIDGGTKVTLPELDGRQWVELPNGQ